MMVLTNVDGVGSGVVNPEGVIDGEDREGGGSKVNPVRISSSIVVARSVAACGMLQPVC